MSSTDTDDDGQFILASIQMDEQRRINAMIRESFRLDPSIKDFLIHEDDVMRIVCARGTKKLRDLFIPKEDFIGALMDTPITMQAILCFVIVHLMRANTEEDIEVKRRELIDQLDKKGCYNGSTRLDWGTTVRVTLFRQGRGKLAIVGRVASLIVPLIDRIGLPHQAVTELKKTQRGLVLITGPMSAGKTRTAQTLLNHRNLQSGGHIITIEDPIETDLRSEKCLITTKEVGVDVATFADGLRDALRQAADVLFIGEMRDKETVKAAINASGSGLLVIATVHGDTCAMALTRMMSLLGDEADGYWGVLSKSLICVLRQALIPTSDEKSWVMVSDAVINRSDSQVSSLLTKGDLSALEKYTSGVTKKEGKFEDWISMNDSLRPLIISKKITLDSAKKASTFVQGLTDTPS